MKRREHTEIPRPVALGSAAISSFHRRPAATTVAVPVVLAPADAA